MDKSAVRAGLLCRRRELSAVVAAELSERIQHRLIGSDLFATADSLALYSSIHQEAATDKIFETALALGKRVFFPRVVGAIMNFVQVYDPDDLQPGAFGVMEPDPRCVSTVPSPDLIVVPGVAFDRSGHRLGYGRGFYDRYLAGCSRRSIKVGLCYSFQLHTGLPADDHDQQLDYLITDTELITCRESLTGLT